jgi:hypothetical protein
VLVSHVVVRAQQRVHDAGQTDLWRALGNSMWDNIRVDKRVDVVARHVAMGDQARRIQRFCRKQVIVVAAP